MIKKKKTRFFTPENSAGISRNWKPGQFIQETVQMHPLDLPPRSRLQVPPLFLSALLILANACTCNWSICWNLWPFSWCMEGAGKIHVNSRFKVEISSSKRMTSRWKFYYICLSSKLISFQAYKRLLFEFRVGVCVFEVLNNLRSKLNSRVRCDN